MAQQKNLLTASPNAIRVIGGNPGLDFSADQIRAINAGTLVLVGPGTTPVPVPPQLRGGCINALRYGKSDTDLVRIAFDSGFVLDLGNATNLNDFRERFQEAANFGHGVSLCHDTTNRRIFMVNIYPCDCTCDKEQQPNPTFPPIITVPPVVTTQP